MFHRLLTFALITAGAAASAETGPMHGQPWTLPLSNETNLKLIWIPPGAFTMGSPESEPGRKKDETQRQVTLTHGYWLGATEVTVAQWRAVMGTDLRGHLTKVIKDDTLYEFAGRQRTIRDFMNMSPKTDIKRYLANEDGALPMYFTSWNDAIEFCEKLTQQERAAGRLPSGYKYTLPTEAQWEHASRAGATVPADIASVAWYGANSTEGYTGKSLGRTVAGPRTAGVKKPNAWGLYDISGNLWEWCLDWYGPYAPGPVTDPQGPATGTLRVNRGGSWSGSPASLRPAGRATNPQAEASAWRGFRLALAFVDAKASQDWIQLFNGRDLTGWTPKIRGYAAGENFANTFAVRDGKLAVGYSGYAEFKERFGHLFWKDSYSYYTVAVEYRFVGEQATAGPGWALRNSGIMVHGQTAASMGQDQDFPISIEVQLLGGNGKDARRTSNLCTPGTNVAMGGKLITAHCVQSNSQTYHGDQWVRAEATVLGSERIVHRVNGETVLEYEQPQIGGGNVSGHDPASKRDGALLESGSISLQSESHPIEFRKVELLDLAGCLDPKAKNYRNYFVKDVKSRCQY